MNELTNYSHAQVNHDAVMYLQEAQVFHIGTQKDADYASEQLKKIALLAKKVDAQRRATVDPLNAKIKQINSDFKKPAEFLAESKALFGSAVAKFFQIQERQAQLAIKKAEEERAALERIEQQKIRDLQEAEAKQQQIAKQAEQSSDPLLQDHALEQVEQIQNQIQSSEIAAAAIIPVVTHAPAQKIAGVVRQQRRSANVVDLTQLCTAVANGLAPVKSILPDMKFLNKQAIAFGQIDGERLYPGVTTIVKTVISTRA